MTARASTQVVDPSSCEAMLEQATTRVALLVDGARRGQPVGWSLKLAHLHAYLDKWLPLAIDRAVDEARREGASWADIGSRLGMSKQAAAKRWSSRAEDVDE